MTDRLDLIRARFASAETVEPLQTSPDPDPGPRSEAPPPDLDAPVDPEAPEGAHHDCARYPLNDIGNGMRFVRYFGEDVKRVSRVGWYCWNGKIWRRDEDDQRGFSPEVRRKSHQVSAWMQMEVPFIPVPKGDQPLLEQLDDLEQALALAMSADEPDKAEVANLKRQVEAAQSARKRRSDRAGEHLKFAKSTGNSAKLDAMLKEGSVALNKTLDDLDANPHEVACESGVLSFSTVEADGMGKVARVDLRGHHRDDLITKMMPVAFDPDAASPKFDAFLERIQPDREMREFIQRWFGLNLTSDTGDQVLAFFYGSGANGKSVLTDLMAKLLGDYATTAKIESLTGTARRGGGDATPDLIPLMGARMVRASEPEQGTRLQEGVIKELTGGEPMLVRALHSDFVEVKPEFKLTISGNHKPDIRGTDDGIWRRVMLIPFEVQIPKAERDPNLVKTLWEEERSGILNWVVAGLIDYLESGLNVPKEVTNATQGYREDSDPIGVFLSDCCEVTGSETEFTRSKELTEAFNWWMDERGEGQWTQRTVTTRIKERAKSFRDPRTGRTFRAAKRSVAGYLGIRLSDMFAARFNEDRARHGGSSGQWGGGTSPDPI